MTSRSLKLRPFQPSNHVSIEIRASLRHLGNAIEFEFLIAGSSLEIADLVWPSALAPSQRSRRNELWKSTCLEVFLTGAQANADTDAEPYLEANVSPSGDWNLYAFDRYREGMRTVSDAVVAAHIEEKIGEPYFRLVGAVRALPGVPDGDFARLLACGELVFSATAVLEYSSGSREYWALHHAGEKPDFHLRSSFKGHLKKEPT